MSTSVSNVVSHFPSAENGFATTTSGSISAGATSVGLNSVAGYTNGEVVALVIDPGDVDKKQTFTGTIDTAGTQVTNVIWTAGTDQTHSAGATVVDYATATHISMITKGLLVSHTQAGHISTSGTATFGANIDVNDSSTAIRDSSDNELLKFSKTASAVNELTVGNASTTNAPYISATGTDTNIDIALNAQGSGDLKANGLPMGAKAWGSWTPTWVNLTVGNGTVNAKYIQIGKTIFYRVDVSFGSTTTIAAACTFTLPVTSVARTGQGENLIGSIYYYDDSSGARNRGDVEWASTTTGRLNVYRTDLTYLQKSDISAAIPFTFTTSDGIQIAGTYQAA